MTVTAFIALGSNVGDRRAAIRGALDALDVTAEVTVTAHSAIVETEPWGEPEQPRYLNAACRLATTLPARALLGRLLAIEAAWGRDRRRERRWGPRTIDLDLLIYGDEVIDEAGLRVPHPRLHERAFVLDPLAEIAPDLVHPVLGRSIQCLRERLEDATRHGRGSAAASAGR